MWRRRSVSSIILIFLLAALPGSGTAKEKKEKPYRIAGVVKGEKGKPAPADSLSSDSSGVRAVIQYLDDPSRRAALASVLGREVDLFPERTGSSRGYMAFALEIENRGSGDLNFEPGHTLLATDRQDVEFPLDYSALYQMVSRSGAAAPSLEEIERAVYGRAVTIRPGGAVRKLLVFEGPRNGKFKKFEVKVRSLHVPSGDLDNTFLFRKFEVKP